VGQSAHRPNSISPPNGGAIAPEQKPFLLGSLGPKSPKVRWGTKAPEGGELDKVPNPKKTLNSIFSKKIDEFF